MCVLTLTSRHRESSRWTGPDLLMEDGNRCGASQMCCWSGTSFRAAQGPQEGVRHSVHRGSERKLEGELKGSRKGEPYPVRCF